MTTTTVSPQRTKAGYLLVGTLLEACSCGVLCPCWIGEDPDGGECFAFNAYHFDTGHIGGIDVSGLNIAKIVHIPGNALLRKSCRILMLVDDRATQEQHDALVGVVDGKFGGPLADLAGLVGEVSAVQSVPIEHHVVNGTGTLHIPGILDSALEPYRGGDGSVTTLRDSIFSTVPGSPAWVSKATKHKVTLPGYGMVWEYENRNAIQADYRMDFAG